MPPLPTLVGTPRYVHTRYTPRVHTTVHADTSEDGRFVLVVEGERVPLLKVVPFPPENKPS